MLDLKIHPHTGEPIRPLYRRPDGRLVWPVMGASPDDPSTGGGTDGEPGGDGGEGTEGQGGKEGGDGSEGEKPVSRTDFERLERHLAEADKKRAAAEAKLKEIEDGKKDDLTKAQEKAAELEKSLQAKESELLQLRLDNAFLSVNDVTWHDKKVAMTVAEREGYLEGVVKDGKVDEKTLASKLKELAKAKAYLVKEDKGNPTPPPSGGAVGSGGKGGKDGGVDEAALRGRYRSLGR